MKDTEALRLLDKEIKSVKALPDPPIDYGDLRRLDTYVQKTTSAVSSALDTVHDVSKYGEAIMEKLDTLRLALERTTIKVQEYVKKALSKLKPTNTPDQQGAQTTKTSFNSGTKMKGTVVSIGAQTKSTSGPSGGQKKNDSPDSKEILEYAQKMQELESKKQKVEESILKTKILMEKLRKGSGITLEDIEKLKGAIDDWLCAKKESMMEKTSKDDQEQGKNEEQKQEERTNEEEDIKQKEESDKERKREEEEKNRREEERLMKQREEEENTKKKEEERLRKEQERLRKEQERMRKEKEEHKRKEEEERKREEEERKRREEERLRKEKEEEEKRKDPDNWTNTLYKRSDRGSDSYHQDICCQVYAMKGTLDEDEFECLASDEWREEDYNMSALGERPASSFVSVEAKSGQKTLSVPMHVSIPYNSVFESSDEDEVVLRVSVNGGKWEEREDNPIVKPKAINEGLRMKGINVSQFKTIKLLIVAKPRSQTFVVDKAGTTEQSSADNRVKLIIPEDTFDESTSVKLVILPIEENSLSSATRFYEHCQNIQSTSSIIGITSDAPMKNEIEVRLGRRRKEDTKGKAQTGMVRHVYKGRDGQWKVPQVKMNSKDSSCSIMLPKGEEQFVVLELEFSRDTPKEYFVETAKELCYHAHATIVRVIAKQKTGNPSMMMIQCISSRKVSSRLDELKKLGYTLGPDISKEFPMRNGQTINFRFSGNISMLAGSLQQLTFHAYMDTAKLETNLTVVDKYGQLDMVSYTGQLHFSVPEEEMEWIRVVGIDGTLPLTLPKTEIQLPHHLTALAKFLAFRLTDNKGKDWTKVLLNLGLQDKVDEIERRVVKADPNPDDDRYIFEIVLREWMTSRPLNEDKVQPIMSSLAKSNRAELEDESIKVIDIHKTFLSDEQVSKMASLVSEDWIVLAFYLGLSDEDINSCKCLSKKTATEEAYRMLCKWRVSERVARSGPNVIKDLISRLDSERTHNQLRYYLKGLISKK